MTGDDDANQLSYSELSDLIKNNQCPIVKSRYSNYLNYCCCKGDCDYLKLNRNMNIETGCLFRMRVCHDVVV